MLRAYFAAALLALALLLAHAARVGLAGEYVDPVGKITAQDEALYSHSAIQMARGSGWLTPVFMGRYALYKPPLLLWLSGFSARILGISRISLRLPVMLLCALAAGIVFLWAAELRSWQAGVCAALLLASNHLWHVLGSMCMTDGLLVAFNIAAMYCLFSDPWLERRATFWGFAAAVAASILTKSVAGLLPLAILGVYWVAAPRRYRPRFSRIASVAGLSVGLALPWFLYEASAHGRWFWMEHVNLEILGFGAGAPPQTSRENPVLFYLMRLAVVDPLLLALAGAAVPTFVRELRQRSAGAVLLCCWIVVTMAAVLGWQYRNVSYLLPVIPALGIVAAAWSPLASGRAGYALTVLLGLAFVAKCLTPSTPWGISFERKSVQPLAAVVSTYCEAGRSNPLILVGMRDDLYATTLPLARLRYAMAGTPPAAGPYAMPFAEMGIIETVREFNDAARFEAGFVQRLREWGLNSTAPIGTLILFADEGELVDLIRDHPEADFLMPARYRSAPRFETLIRHRMVGMGDHVFLFSRESGSIKPAWTCRL